MIIMSKLQWYVNRLLAMDVCEIAWRLQQIAVARKEKKRFGQTRKRVNEEIWNKRLSGLMFHAEALGMNMNNTVYSIRTDFHPLQGPDYGQWPDTFSYSLNYKQRDDLGDARTCWEKHRHFQYVLLAKVYHTTGSTDILLTLKKELDEWCDKNSFLHGIAWTSVMEVAIRSINWMTCMAFLTDKQLLGKMRIGVINMTDYIVKHYSRFSSANNHLLVEAVAIGMAGFALNHEIWKTLATAILSKELHKQNYEDGVNKELSLHYQTFGMEAYCLMARLMSINGMSVPEDWKEMLGKQGEYVAHAVWNEHKAMEFGDDDEGKILDLHGGIWPHFNYILQFCSLIVGRRYHSFNKTEENICWLFKEEEIKQIKSLPMYDNTSSRCFHIGGNTFLRDRSNRILIGIDHAALGFGHIAAHGHADALSIQMMVDGETVLADPGTYIYHCNLPMRDAFRKTINHNTLCLINEKNQPIDQSQMLGAFLWGKRAECRLESWKSNEEHDTLTASHNGYRPVIHQRTAELLYKDTPSPLLRVKDAISGGKWVATWMLGKECGVERHGCDLVIISGRNRVLLRINTDVDDVCIEDADISNAYGVKERTKAIRIYGNQHVLSVDFKIVLG